MASTLKGSHFGRVQSDPFRVEMVCGHLSGGGAALCPRLLPATLSGSTRPIAGARCGVDRIMFVRAAE